MKFHPHPAALERGKQAVRKIADILRQCYAFVIRQTGIVAWELACNIDFTRAPDCIAVESVLWYADYRLELRLSYNDVDHHVCCLPFSKSHKKSLRGAQLN